MDQTLTKNNATKWLYFYLKFDLLKFLCIDNLHKKFGRDISKIEDFFYCQTFDGHLSVFSGIKKQSNDH